MVMGVRQQLKPQTQEERKRKLMHQCTYCGTPLANKRLTYCNENCRNKYWEKHSWTWLRPKILKRDNFTCQECGLQIKVEGAYYVVVADPQNKLLQKSQPRGKHGNGFWFIPLVVDHILAIALGGDEWDENNLLTRCYWCNKAKTRRDIAKIAKVRKVDDVTRKRPLNSFFGEKKKCNVN